MKKLATTVLVVVTMLLTSCTPNEVECNCKVESINYEEIKTKYYNPDTDSVEVKKEYLKTYEYRESGITDCDRNGEIVSYMKLGIIKCN